MLSKLQNDYHMVARGTSTTGSSGRSITDFSVLGNKLPKWKPRGGLSGHPTWVDAIEDTAAQVGLMAILRSARGAPTLREVGERYAGRSLDSDEFIAILEQCLREWSEMSTAFYFFVRPTIILTGEHEKDDLETISTFRGDGGDRDGWGLWQWLKQWSDSSTHEAQASLRQLIDAARLSSTANLDQLELHANDMLRNWVAIDSNDIAKPAPFYHLLLHSLQVVATSPTLLNDVRKWLITSTIDSKSELFLKPKVMMTLMINYAKLIGLPRSQASLLAMHNEKNTETRTRMRNNCKTCDFSTCDSETRGGVTKCRMMNKSCRTPTWASKLTEGQTAYMKSGDDYLAANPGTTTLKGVKLVIPPRVAGATRTRPAARGKQPQVTPILGHAGSSSESTDAEMFVAFVASRMNEIAMPVIEYDVKWQLAHDEEWDQLQQPDVHEMWQCHVTSSPLTPSGSAGIRW